MRQNKFWDKDFLTTITKTKYLLSNLSVGVRTDQFNILKAILKPDLRTVVLDVGVASDEVFVDSNMFEKLYPYPMKLTLATIEDSRKLAKMYPKSKVVKLKPGNRLPFRDNQFDLGVSWATLEHVGSYIKQQDFINEILRVCKKVFLTTPYRGCVYEPHSGIFFLHWLPLKLFRSCMVWLNKRFWSDENNLNPLYLRDLQKMRLNKKMNIKIYKIFNLLPSHILIYKK